MIQTFLSKRFLLFLLTGGIAAIVNILSRILFNIHFNFSMSVVLAYLAGMVVAFALARLFVFSDCQQPLHKSGAYFVIVNLFGILQTWLISIGLANHLFPAWGVSFHPHEVAHILGVAFPALTSYLGHKKYSFGP